MNGGVYSVSALTRAVKGSLEGAFPFVWVRGQVANLARPGSGHMYFSLRDESSTLAAVWFKGKQREEETFDPLTGEVYEDGPKPGLAPALENGQEVICAGRLSVYPARGVYQLQVELARDAGLGRLHEEFERLRGKLAVMGYFALERKRSLPFLPKRVAVITSPQGAAVRDFLRIAQTRGIGAVIRIYPSPVQGSGAPLKLRQALERVIDEGWAQVAVFLRGGGSLEDLWAFNDQDLAGAVFSSAVPVVAGIGHEVDFTLVDMTADVRAATPTHAAQLLWPEREDLARSVADLAEALGRAEGRYLAGQEARWADLFRNLRWRSPERNVENWRERLELAVRRMTTAVERLLERRGSRLELVCSAIARAPERLGLRQAALESLAVRVAGAGEHQLAGRERLLERLALRLEAVDPHAPLERGYALVRDANGVFVRSKDKVNPGERLRIMVRDGEIPVRVEEETPREQ